MCSWGGGLYGVLVPMKVVSWNVWSLGKVSKRALVRQDLGAIRAGWIALQKTKFRLADSWLVN